LHGVEERISEVIVEGAKLLYLDSDGWYWSLEACYVYYKRNLC